MPKPIKLPTWATGATSILEPSDGKKAQGWVPGEQPPASIFNYWQNLVHEWITWLDANGLVDGGSLGDLLVNGTLSTTGDTMIGVGAGANAHINGTLTTVGLARLATLETGGDATVGWDGSGNLHVKGDVDATGLYAYTTPPTRTKAISVAQGGGSVIYGQYVELAPGAEHVYVVDAPHGATLGNVRIKLLAFSGGAGSNVHYTVRLMRRHAIDFASTGVPNHTPIDSNSETLTAGPSAVNRTRPFGGLAVSKDETYEIALRCESDSGAGCALRILALDYSFVDPGPRNH